MNESIHRYFKVGILYFVAWPQCVGGAAPDMLECLRTIACDAYFDAVELNWFQDTAVLEQAAQILLSAHMDISYCAQPCLLTQGLNPNALEEDMRLKAEAALMVELERAGRLGAKRMAFLSGKWEKETREESYAQLLKTTRNLCRAAAEKGLMVELEVFDYDISKKSLIGPAPLAARFASDIRSRHNNFGLMVDLSHIPMTHETSEFVVRTLRPYITHFHIGNTVCSDPAQIGYGDEHQRFGFPGGSNDVPQLANFLRVLRQEGFFDKDAPYFLSFEVKPVPGEDPKVVLAGSKRTLNRAWSLLD